MDDALRAIAEPNRRRILLLIAHDELPAGQIAGAFAISRPAVSQHLQVLVGAGLAEMRKDGTRRLYRACPDKLAEIRNFFDQFWDAGLARLKRAAEQAEQGERSEQSPKQEDT